jgi:hypothetical protein
MPSTQYSDTTPNEPPQRPSGLWKSLLHLWCRHPQTITTPRVGGMPPHVVCQSCGWREPVLAAAPQGTRTWDSSRDEARYRLEKKRREAVEDQRQLVVAKLATPAPRKTRRPHTPGGNLLHMKPAVGE